jgi:RHS repeat-associated protein
VVAHYRYAPFGLDAVFGADDDPVRFVARAEIGELMLLGERVYDPAVGRFLSPDPLFQVVNQFAYTLGNPIWFSDADGRSEAANGSVQAVANGLGIAGGALNLIGGLMRFAPTPQTVVLGNGLLLLGSILLLLAIILRTSSGAGAIGMNATSGGGGSVGTAASGTASPAPGCSPATGNRLPDVTGWLYFLLPLQLLLGWLLLRRRRREDPL